MREDLANGPRLRDERNQPDVAAAPRAPVVTVPVLSRRRHEIGKPRARLFLTPSHVKASLTAAIVVRSLLAELGVV
jgi:hypothetical protein